MLLPGHPRFSMVLLWLSGHLGHVRDLGGFMPSHRWLGILVFIAISGAADELAMFSRDEPSKSGSQQAADSKDYSGCLHVGQTKRR